MAFDTKKIFDRILALLNDRKPHTAAYISEQLSISYKEVSIVLEKSVKEGLIRKCQMPFGESSIELFSLPPPLRNGSTPTTTTSWQIRYKRIL